MEIKSRGELVELINKHGVETFPVPSNPGSRIVNTIVEDENERFYRVVWGEIVDDKEVTHLWFNQKAEEVFLNKSNWKPGWLTKKEIKEIEIVESRKSRKVNMDEFELQNVDKNLVDIEEERLQFENLQTIGGRSGQGKTQYALTETAKAIAEDKSVLYFSTETTSEEVNRRLLRVLAHKAYTEFENREGLLAEEIDELKDALSLIKNAKLVIDDSKTINDDYIVKKMTEYSKSENGLDFVVIDYLQMVTSSDKDLDNYDAVVAIHKKLDKVSAELGCRVLITTQLNRDNQLAM